MDAETLVKSWLQHFWDADHEIEWLDAEMEHQVELVPGIILMGRIDAIGRNSEGKLFFGEWKTSRPEWKTRRGEWKKIWRLNPQSLTYGVLVADKYPECDRFTVRKAFKSEPPAYDYAWYQYSQPELVRWRLELIRVADDIRRYGSYEPWPTNFNACFKYGINNVCPWFEPACSKLNWTGQPEGAKPRESHLEMERRLNELVATKQDEGRDLANGKFALDNSAPLILDATRVATWFDCRERFRREYIENVSPEPSEAMKIGLDFHDLLSAYYTKLVKKELK